MKLPIRIRRATEEDISFIFHSWLKSFRSSVFARQVSNTIYFSEHHKVLQQLFKTAEVLVACNNEDASQIYGYICAEKIDGIFVLHYVYVKHPYRKLGIAKTLLSTLDRNDEEAGCFTHYTHIAEKLAARYNLIHHPYLLYNLEESENQKELKEDSKESNVSN